MMEKVRVSASRVPTRSARVPTASGHNPFYSSKEWTDLVARVIAKRGRVCEELHCARRRNRDGTQIRIFADHIVELRDGGAPLDEANIMLRCGSCHTKKTIAVRAQRLAQRY